MSLHYEMLQVARLAPRQLDTAADLVRCFLQGLQGHDGGFCGRTEASDLYYTVFALDSLAALRSSWNNARLRDYLEQTVDWMSLDFVHLCCLARVWRICQGIAPGEPLRLPQGRHHELAARLERHRARDGGYHPVAGGPFGSAYGCFLAVAAYQDLGLAVPEPHRLVECVEALLRPGGGFANEAGLVSPATNSTAAAVAVLRQVGGVVSGETGQWLLRQCHPMGGFLAAPGAPLPDLLSTATALHTLSALETDYSVVQEACLDFVDSLWTNQGGFHGQWADDHLDAEYTFYGLLALGHLSL